MSFCRIPRSTTRAGWDEEASPPRGGSQPIRWLALNNVCMYIWFLFSFFPLFLVNESNPRWAGDMPALMLFGSAKAGKTRAQQWVTSNKQPGSERSEQTDATHEVLHVTARVIFGYNFEFSLLIIRPCVHWICPLLAQFTFKGTTEEIWEIVFLYLLMKLP